jgi:integrase
MARPKKSTRFLVREFKNASGNLSYRVDGYQPSGKRIRQNFSTRLEAERERADLEAEYFGMPTTAPAKRTRLSDEQLADAEAAIKGASDRGLAEIVAHYLAIEKRLKSKGIEIDSAVSFAESHFREELVSVSILNAYNEFIRSRADKASRTKAYYESTLRLLLKPDPNKQLHTFTVSEIEKILFSYKNTNSKRAYRTAFSVFFNWAVRHHYCLEDPCKRLDKMPKDMSQIAALSFEESKRLLYAAMCVQDGASAAVVAIGLFAGLRPSEIKDLKPEDIGEKVISISGGKLRRKLKRTAPIPPVLAAWLEKYPFTGLPGGWDYKMKALKKATKAKKWVQDIIRHTSITFQTERDKNEGLTAYNCGTSIQMMNQHYRNTIDDDKVVAAFWALTPAKLLANKPEIELPSKPKVAWPDKKALAKLVWQKPLVHAAADIGVSDVALKKHCVKISIDLPPPGHWVRQRPGGKI